MKKIIYTIFTTFLLTAACGQKTELQFQLNSGLFSFSGKSAENSSFINYSDQNKSGYTNNPYGSKSGLSFGVSGNIKRLTKNRLLFGTEIGFEILRSKTRITEISGYTGSTTYNYGANGQTFLNYYFLNLHPFIGYRIMAGNLPFDLTAGLDIGYCIDAKEKGKATATNGMLYETSVDRKTIKSDIRPRFQIATRYNKIGVFCGYSIGVTNYKPGYIGGTNECYARLLRFGLTYQLK